MARAPRLPEHLLGPGTGGFVLWPLFGTTNQLVGGLTPLIQVLYLKSRNRPLLPVVLPMVFLVTMTTVAGGMNLHGELGKASPSWPVVVFGVLFLALEALMFIEAIRVLRSRRSIIG